MRNFNSEVYRDNIHKVDRVPISEWKMVQRKKKNKSSLSILCNKFACNSKCHTEDRCWWIHPELRPNYKFLTVPKQGSEFEQVNQNVNKVIKPHVSDSRSLMKCHHDFILCKISQESNSEIRIH